MVVHILAVAADFFHVHLLGIAVFGVFVFTFRAFVAGSGGEHQSQASQQQGEFQSRFFHVSNCLKG